MKLEDLNIPIYRAKKINSDEYVEGFLNQAINFHRKNNENLKFEYSDDGMGMHASVLAKLYEPFFTTRRGKGGTGLGMHIVYNLVTQSLGGRITCKSAPGKGTRFIIIIPLKNLK